VIRVYLFVQLTLVEVINIYLSHSNKTCMYRNNTFISASYIGDNTAPSSLSMHIFVPNYCLIAM